MTSGDWQMTRRVIWPDGCEVRRFLIAVPFAMPSMSLCMMHSQVVCDERFERACHAPARAGFYRAGLAKWRVPLVFQSERPDEAIEAVCPPLQSGVALRLSPHSKKKLSQHSTRRAGQANALGRQRAGHLALDCRPLH
jgi:hypothetical protein